MIAHNGCKTGVVVSYTEQLYEDVILSRHMLWRNRCPFSKIAAGQKIKVPQLVALAEKSQATATAD